eukprot:8612532-Pyramimonas_sp.AAC.1
MHRRCGATLWHHLFRPHLGGLQRVPAPFCLAPLGRAAEGGGDGRDLRCRVLGLVALGNGRAA